jgi:integrase
VLGLLGEGPKLLGKSLTPWGNLLKSVLVGMQTRELLVAGSGQDSSVPTGTMTAQKNNVAETVGHEGSTIEIRKYLIGGKIEYRFPYRDAGNQRRFRCCRTLESARKAAEDYLVGLRNGRQEPKAVEPSVGPAQTLPGTFPKTFAEICEFFLSGRQSKFARQEMRYASFRDTLTRVAGLKKVLGGTRMDKVNVLVLDRAMSELGALSPRSLWNYRNILGTILRWAVSRDHAPDAVLKAYRVMEFTGSKDRQEAINPFNPAEVRMILEAARTNVYDPTGTPFKMMAVVALQSFAGMRAAEACRLGWEDIDLGAGIIRVKRMVAKVKSPRLVPMTDNLRRWLALVPHHMRQGPVYSGHAYSKAQGRLTAPHGGVNGPRWVPHRTCQPFQSG